LRGGMAKSPVSLNNLPKLSRNPLGIIALFIALVYGIAGLVASTRRNEFSDIELTTFLCVFPFAVLVSFHIVVANNFFKLFSPEDIGRDQFERIVAPYLPTIDVVDIDIHDPDEREEIKDEDAKSESQKIFERLPLLSQSALIAHSLWESSDMRAKRTSFKSIFRNNNDIDDIMSDELSRATIFDVLNTLESFASDIIRNKFMTSEATLEFKVTWQSYWRPAKKIVEKIRAETKKTYAYANLEVLAKAWGFDTKY
jgi:hypothetical protein